MKIAGVTLGDISSWNRERVCSLTRFPSHLSQKTVECPWSHIVAPEQQMAGARGTDADRMCLGQPGCYNRAMISPSLTTDTHCSARVCTHTHIHMSYSVLTMSHTPANHLWAAQDKEQACSKAAGSPLEAHPSAQACGKCLAWGWKRKGRGLQTPTSLLLDWAWCWGKMQHNGERTSFKSTVCIGLFSSVHPAFFPHHTFQSVERVAM